MKTVFLTGGTGFLGGHVAAALVERGWRIRALARPGSRAKGLADAGVELFAGDLSAAADLAGACEGCDAIVHVAGLVKARTLEDYREVNVRGTETLLRAAARSASSAAFLLVSSQAAAGPARDGRPLRENDPPAPVSWYGVSKREGEEAVARLWQGKGSWAIVRPSVVYGPGDRGLLLLFRAAAKGLIPVPAGRSRIQTISAQRAALGIARAAERPEISGRIGFLTDPDPVAIGDLCGILSRLPPRPARLLPLPDALVALAGFFQTAAETISRRSLAFNADKAREILAGDWLCDGEPLARRLDLPAPVSLEKGLFLTWRWYVDQGWIVL